MPPHPSTSTLSVMPPPYHSKSAREGMRPRVRPILLLCGLLFALLGGLLFWYARIVRSVFEDLATASQPPQRTKWHGTSTAERLPHHLHQDDVADDEGMLSSGGRFEHEGLDLSSYARPAFPQIPVVEPLNMEEIMRSCPKRPDADKRTVNDVNQEFEKLLERKIRDERCEKPLTETEFLCASECPVVEEELERTVRIMRLGDHSAIDVLRACLVFETPLLLWFDHRGRVKWLNCHSKRRHPDDHLMGRSPWEETLKLLFTLSCVVELPKNLVVGFDAGDFVTPTWYAPHHKLQYVHPLPPIMRYTGTLTHYGLLFPTGSHVVAVAHCDFRRDDKWWRVCHHHHESFHEWESKSPKFFWRGLPTGVFHDSARFYTHRQRFVMMRRIKDLAEGPQGEKYRNAFDAAFVQDPPSNGGIHNFDKYDMALFRKYWVKRKIVPKTDNPKYRYLLHVDGNTASWGISHKLVSNSAMFWARSAYNYREYFYVHLRPFEHFIPLALDFSDLGPVVDWTLSHDAEVARVARRAHRLFETRLKPSSIYCYIYRMLSSVKASQSARGPDVKYANASQLSFEDVVRMELGPDIFSEFEELTLLKYNRGKWT